MHTAHSLYVLIFLQRKPNVEMIKKIPFITARSEIKNKTG